MTGQAGRNESRDDRADDERLTLWSRRAMAGFWTSAILTWLWVMPGVPFGLSSADYTDAVLTIFLLSGVAFATGGAALYLRFKVSRAGLTWRRLALHDPLTGLANRTLLEQRWRELWEIQRPAGKQVGLLFVDLDHFKDVNDQHGHVVGDKILIALADRLGRGLGPSATIVRYGGDEFVILLEKTGGLEQTGAVAEAILREIREPFRTEGLEIVISASIGAALANGPGPGLSGLIEAADRAAYEAKLLGLGRYVASTASSASSGAA